MKGWWWRLASLSPERGFPEGLATRRYRPSRKWSGCPRSSLTCQYCPHHACVLGPELRSLTGGIPGGHGSDSHRETLGVAPSPLRQRAQCLPIRGALSYFQNCCSEAVEIRMLFMTKPIQSKLLFCFKNIWMPMPYCGSCDRFCFLGLKNHCRWWLQPWDLKMLAPWKAMTNTDGILKSRDITLPTKVHIVKTMVLPVVTYGYESWTTKKAEHWRTDAFKLCCWRRLCFNRK